MNNDELRDAKRRQLTLPLAILATLIYSDHFDFPLTMEELHSRLISLRVSRPQLTLALNQLIQAQQILLSSPYYHLPARSQLVSLRTRRQAISRGKLALASNYATQLAKVPGVLALYLTGSLAVKNARVGDDLDLMVITKPGRLWTTRLLLTLYTSALRLRRTPHSTHNSGKLCLNLYLEPCSLELPKDRRSLYTAYELIQAVPLYDPVGTHHELLAANSWIESYLPNFPLSTTSPSTIYHLPSTISQLVERLAYHLQLLYMKPRITRELVTPHSAFFHPHDPSRAVLKKISQ